MILLISYDLNGKERPSAYADVKEVIEDRAVEFRKPLYSQWLVKTDETPRVWRDALKEVMDSNDNLLIVEVHSNYSGWLNKEVWPWLKKHVRD